MCRKLGKRHPDYVDRSRLSGRDGNTGKVRRDALGRPVTRLYSFNILNTWCDLADKFWRNNQYIENQRMTHAKDRYLEKIDCLHVCGSVRAPTYDEHWNRKRLSNHRRNNVCDFGSRVGKTEIEHIDPEVTYFQPLCTPPPVTEFTAGKLTNVMVPDGYAVPVVLDDDLVKAMQVMANPGGVVILEDSDTLPQQATA